MPFLAIFQTGIFKVLKTVKNAIFVNFFDRRVVGRHAPSFALMI